jgi:uncharacterized protein (DUF2267 family)
MSSPLETMLDQVQERGRYTVRGEAARAVEIVLDVLGAHLVGDDRSDLAHLLPHQCEPILTSGEPASEPLTPRGFIEAVASRAGGDFGDARRDVTAVLGIIAESADDALLRRILTQLPPGHAGLFGRTEPV